MIELLGLTPAEVAALIPHRPVLVGYRGSIAHGMYVAPTEPTGIDDKDIIVAYVPDLSTYFGLHTEPPKGRDIKIREWDCAAYEIRKLAGLLVNANPNVLSLLWLDSKHLIHVEPEGRALIENRRLFASRRAADSFGGYAYSQLKRMTRWDPEQLRDGHAGRGSEKPGATGFMGEKRKRLVAEHGYDTKNAAHLIRLLRMGIGFLRDGELLVDRTGVDAAELLSIKRGEWPIERVQSEADRLFAEMRGAVAVSPLPEQPDLVEINRILVDALCRSKHTEIALRASATLTPLYRGTRACG